MSSFIVPGLYAGKLLDFQKLNIYRARIDLPGGVRGDSSKIRPHPWEE